jgi:hypothetical protein
MRIRTIAKSIAVVIVALLSIAMLAIIGFLGFLFYKAAVPDRVSVTGRVTDSGGKPLKGVEVRAVPLPPNLSFVEDPKPQDNRVFTAATDTNGRYRLNGLAARCGVKEGMHIQEYNIVVRADGYVPRQVHFQKPPRSRERIITGVDFVLERKAAVFGSIVGARVKPS